MSEQSARSQRPTGGLIGAMLVLVVVVVAAAGVHSLLVQPPAHPVPSVDYARDVPDARRAASFALLAPPSLPRGWRATTVGFTDGRAGHWHLGVLTPAGRYVGLEQSRRPVSELVDEYVGPGARRGAAVAIAGRSWGTWTDSGGDLALAHRTGATSTLVVGHVVPRATLVRYVERLR